MPVLVLSSSPGLQLISVCAAAIRDMGDKYLITQELWPVVVSIVGEGATDEEVEEYITRMERVYVRKERILWVTHIKPFVRANREHTRRFAEWIKEHREAVRTYNMGIAFVTESTAFRFVLSTLFLFQSLDPPYKIMGTTEEAERWLADRAKVIGLKLPERLAERLREVIAR